MSREPVYVAKKVNMEFPGVHALKDVDFDLYPGEIHGLVGHNGAGKSTLVKVLTGVHRPSSGMLFLEGEQVSFSQPKDALEKNIGIVTQEGTLLPTHTGVENIFLGCEFRRFGIVQNSTQKKAARKMIDEIGLEVNLNIPVQELSPAQRKVIEIIKVLNHSPKVLILDEPTAALSAKERDVLFSLMKKLRDTGIGIVFISHYLEEVIDLCDRTTVMRDGMVVDTMTQSETSRDRIIRGMLNKEQKTDYVRKTSSIGELLLQIKGLSDGQIVRNASIDVHKGEVIGLFGAVGSGRTEFVEMVFGAKRIASGEIYKNGTAFKPKSVRNAIKNGIALIPDDRLTKALLLHNSIAENLSLPFLKNYSKSGFVQKRSENKYATEVMQRLDIKAPGIFTEVSSLSGGNKQKVAFGKWISGKQNSLDVFIFDEPTEGVDVGVRAEMHRIITELAESGKACIVVSSDVTEVIGLSDRIYVMYEGEIVAEYQRETDDLQKQVISSSLGIIKE